MKEGSPKLKAGYELKGQELAESVEVGLEHFQNDIDFLNLINDGMTAQEFNDIVMKLRSA